ncbi:unnamed protein product [Eruca vesicaria subsp. sativa]|uniref:Uncharacterized protein n=1 Tax=Eruca vesicaria subsp. sativa TaxID=29727 RepID=A0ABC8KG83_ERUVS|nr:unnamed protein product [Eruca vesicaria subsp. sativa]
MARLFASVFLLLGFALAGVSYAADSSSPSPPTMTTSNTTVKSPPVLPIVKNSTDATDYTDYEVPLDLAPGGVEVVDDYAPFNTGRGPDELAQPEEDLKSKGSEPKNSASSSFSSSSYVVFVGAAGLFLF